MYAENGEWVLNEAELGEVASRLGLQNGVLGVLPARGDSPPGTWEAFQALDSRPLLEKALGILAEPRKVVRLHEVQGGEHVSRSTLALGPEDVWITLVRAGELRRISLRSQGELRLHLQGLLAADESIRGNRLGATLSTPALLALLAAVEHLRRLRLLALLNHEEPSDLFSAEDVARRLQAADVEDFRWMLPFLEKLLPIPVKDLAVATDPLPALAELVQGGLLLPFDGGTPPSVFELSEAGRFLADAYFHEGSRAGLAITALHEDGVAGHDVLVFLRSPFDLLMLYFSGPLAGVSTMQGGDMDLAVMQALAPLPSPAPASPVPASPAPGSPAPGSPAPAPATEAFMIPPESAAAGLPAEQTVRRRPLHLDVESGISGGKHFVLAEGGVLGRAAESDIMLTDVGISRRHAAFERTEGGLWTVRDLGSSNGTYVNGQKLEAPCELKSGDRVQICSILIRIAQV